MPENKAVNEIPWLYKFAFFSGTVRLSQLSSQTCSLTQALEAHQVIFMPAYNMCSSYVNLLERAGLEHLDQRKLEGIKTHYL